MLEQRAKEGICGGREFGCGASGCSRYDRWRRCEERCHDAKLFGGNGWLVGFVALRRRRDRLGHHVGRRLGFRLLGFRRIDLCGHIVLALFVDQKRFARLRSGAPNVPQPVKIDIDLDGLGHIRSAAAQTREALLIDEEREDDVPTEVDTAESEQPEAKPATDVMAEPIAAPTERNKADEPTISTEQFGVVAPLLAPTPAVVSTAPAGTATELAPAADAFLRALLEQNAAQATLAVVQSEQSEDMLVDSINEALFDLVGDTVIEFGAAGPQIIEDYEADVRGYLDHE